MVDIKLIVSIPFLLIVSSAGAAAPSIDIKDAWQETRGGFAQALRPGAGFSFAYDGKKAGPAFSSEEWSQAIDGDAKSGITRTVLRHRSGLVVTREVRLWPGFDAVEYRLHFKNTAQKALAPLSQIKALDLSFGDPVLAENCVVSSGGGLGEAVLPSKAFAIRKQCFVPTFEDHAIVKLTTEGGRSSNKDMPFFFLHNDARQTGAFVAFGWSGQWTASVQQGADTFDVTAMIPDLDIALEPGEEIQGPSVLVGFYEGELSEGSNRLRRLIREGYTPKLAGQPFLPVAIYDTWFGGIELKFDEGLLRQLADGAAAIGQEYFLLDAGWFVNPEGKGFLPGLGNWELIDQQKFPNGLKPFADYVRSKGMKFGLWFEPERVGRGSKLAAEHPDWVLWTRDERWQTAFNELISTGPGYGLLDYGRPEVQRWVREMLDGYIRDYGIKYIRYDFNIDPLTYWAANEKPGRRGLRQLRHIQGLYAILDWIRERHPDTVLEGCASGGRRIDLETARRFHTFWISDYTVDPSVLRFHLFGINYFLPGNYHYIQYTLPTPQQKNFQPDDFGFQNLFAGAMGTGGRFDRWSEPMKAVARHNIEIHKNIRRYLNEDYYPLSAQPGDLKSWSGWQFHDPKDQSGFVQTFRTKTSGASHRFFVRGLDAQARYRFTDPYSQESFVASGSAAMNQGIEVKQTPMSSRVFIYRKLH